MPRALVRGGNVWLVTCGVVVLVATTIVSTGAGLANTAAGAAPPANPLRVVLTPAAFPGTPSDFPANADPADAGPMPPSFARKLRGIHAVGRGARFFASIPFGPERTQTVSGLVVTTPSTVQARKVFAWQKRTALRRRRGDTRLRLPRFGDEQVGLLSGETDSGRLLVRRNRVVWRLEVAADGALRLSPARIRGELVKYATKQGDRVGRG
jgi:hypothetical protein